jgi:asparagine synthase (glutamine-hydrolysing)
MEEVASPRALRDAGVFRVEAARKLITKCRGLADGGQLSNSDNMALVGMLSTQLLHAGFIQHAPSATLVPFKTVEDRVETPTKR